MTITSNDLLVYESGVWTSPSEVSVFDSNTSSFVNATEVYVYKNGSWVQSWPPILANVYTGFDPYYIMAANNSVYFSNIGHSYIEAPIANTTIKCAQVKNIGRDPYNLNPKGYGYHFNIVDSLIAGGQTGNVGSVNILRRLATTVGSYRSYANSSILIGPTTNSAPVEKTTYTVPYLTSVNSFDFYDPSELFYPSETRNDQKYVGLVLVGNSGKVSVTSNVWTRPDIANVNFATDHFNPTITFKNYQLSTASNFTRVSVEPQGPVDPSFTAYMIGTSATYAELTVYPKGVPGSGSSLPTATQYIVNNVNGLTSNFNDFGWSANTGESRLQIGAFDMIVGDNGVFLERTYSGWSARSLGTSQNLNAIECHRFTTIIVGDNGTIYRYNDNSDPYGPDPFNPAYPKNQWYQVTSPTTENLTSVTCIVENDIPLGNAVESDEWVITGENGTILYSNNSGRSWATVTTAISNDLIKVDRYPDTQADPYFTHYPG